MLNLSENTYLFLWFLLLFVIGLIIYFTINYQRIKVIEADRLKFLHAEIEVEKKASKQLEKAPQEIQLLNKNTHLKFQKIKVDVLDINFTLSEIF